MPFVIDWEVRVSWVGDGVSQMGAVPSSQTKTINNKFGANSGLVVVPGADSPTGANFTTAATTVGTNIGTALNVAATLAQLQAFSTGGP